MPSDTIEDILADRYGCDGQFAASLVIGTYLISLVSLSFMIVLHASIP